MSKASAKTSAPQRTLTTATNLPEKRLSAKLDKHQAQEDDNLVMSDAAPQSTDVIVSTVGAAPSMSDAPFMLAQADTATSTAASGGATTAAPTTASPLSSVLSSGWALGAAAVGAVAVVAHNTPAGAAVAAVAATVNAVANGGIVAGPVLANNDLVVHLYAADGTTQIGTATVNGSGQYTANLGNYTGVVIAKVSSTGSQLDYFDEATHQAVDLGAHVLTAVGVASATGLTLSINPLTTIAAQVAGVAADGSVSAAITATAVESANTTVATAFGITGSLIAPTALNAVVDATGSANAHADAYGKVLAVLSGLDQINGGDLQAAIQAFATDLTSNNGQLSATSKFSLVVAAQDADLTSVSSGLASTIGSLAQIDASDIHEVISSGRSNFSNDELASALSTVLNTNIHVADIDAVIESITVSAGNDLTSLTQAAGRYIALSSGSVLIAAEAQGVVTLSVHGLDIVAGDTVTVTINDPTYASNWQAYTPSVLTLQVASDGQSVELPTGEFWNDLYGEGQVTVTVTTASEQSVATTFGTDLWAPSAFNHNNQGLSTSLSPSYSNFSNGYTNSAVTITAPYDWNPADHWQYRIGDGEWIDGPDFVYNENNNNPYTAQLQLSDGTYGVSDNNKIYMRTYDDAGNISDEVVARYPFIADTTAPTLSVEQDGHVTISETGVVILMNDAVFNTAGGDLFTAIYAAGRNQYTVFQATSDADVNQPLTLSTAGLAYGSYHYYAMDYAGNIATLQNGSAVTIDSHAPVVNENAGVADQTVYLGQDLSIAIDTGTIFTDPDGNPLTYTATLLDANGTAVSSDWLTLTMVDTWNLTLTATASDVAANAATGPLTIRLTATDAAGLTVKTVSDDFTLTYIPEILNHAPVLEWPIGSWNVNVGVDTNWGDIQTRGLDIFSDSDNDPLTYAITNADGSPAPAWLSIHTDSNGNPFLQAIPLAGDVSDTPYQFTVTATDGHSDPVSDTFDLVVGDNGLVFYPGEALSSFNLTLAANSVTGQAITTSHPDSVLDLGVNNTYFFGGPAMGDTANLHLDNATGGTLSDGTAPSLTVENFSTVNLLVDSHTELQNLSMYRLYSADELLSQNVTIQTGTGAALVVDWMDTADFANTTMSISGSDDVTINKLDGNWGSYTDTSGIVQSPEMFLSANQLTGKLNVTYQGLAATLFGGQNDDTITGGDGDDTISGYLGSDTLTGGNGADVFYYASSLDANDSLRDVITDFTTGVDKIRVNLSNNASDANNLHLTFSVVADYNTGVNDALTGTGKMGESFYSTLDESLYIDTDGNGSVTDSTDFVIRSANVINAGDLEFMIAGTSHIV
jgi:RTX calcium-binding nonapeptide repeat (4 copies)